MQVGDTQERDIQLPRDRCQILLIRPKMWLVNDGNYRELRYFTPWQKHCQWEDHYLPCIVCAVTGQVRTLPKFTRNCFET